MAMMSLSKNEKVVLYCMVRSPLLNDRQISMFTGIKMSTITAIRNRLIKRELFSTVRIPLLPQDLCELLYMSVVPLAHMKGKQKPGQVKDLCQQIPEISLCSLDTEALLIGMARNYTNFHKAKQRFIDGLCQKGLYHKSPGWDHVFAREGSEVSNLFDHSHLLSIQFQKKDGIELPIIKPHALSHGESIPITTTVEKKVFTGLIKHPMSADTKLSESIHITRQIIAKLRSRFEREGLMRTVRLVNLKRMGFEVMVLVGFKFDPMATVKSRKRALRALTSEMPVVFSVTDAMKGVALLVFSDFQETKTSLASLSGSFTHGGLLASPLEFRYFSVPDQQLAVYHNYGPLIEKILGRE